MRSSTPQDPQEVSAQAASWLHKLSEDDSAQDDAFLAWLKKSPQHIEEFLFATTAWRRLRELGTCSPPSVESILAELHESGADNVVSLDQGVSAATTVPRMRSSYAMRASKWQRMRRMSAAVAATVIASVAIGWWGQQRAEVYKTSIGEQRTVPLPDGSVLYLNTASRVRLQFSRESREIELSSGEALFSVAHDAARPFRVIAGATVVQAVGTQFNVRRDASGARVSVIEGRVRILYEAGSPSQIAEPTPNVAASGSRAGVHDVNVLDAGEEATVAGNGRMLRQASADVAGTIAWRERRVVFRAERLETVIAEINRYATQRFRVNGEHARNTTITATFDVDRPESLVAFLRRYSDLSVTRAGDEIVIQDGIPAESSRMSPREQ